MVSSPTHSNPAFLYKICTIAALAGLLLGYDTGVISGAILFIRKDFDLSDASTEAIVSAVLIGALVGSTVGGRFTDSLGRKKVLIVSSLIFILGSLASALVFDQNGLFLSRVLLGIAIGVSSSAAPLYLAEIAPPEIRGKLVSLNQLAITIGILSSYIVCYALAGQETWRWMLGLGVFPALTFLFGLLFLPESPRWLLMKGDPHQEAVSTLRAIRGRYDVEGEIQEIRTGLIQKEGGWRLLLSGWVRPILWVAVGLSLIQQTTGINVIIYYAPSIFQLAGFQQAEGAILASLGLGLVNVLATVVALPLIDRWGRRPLLLMGLVGMGISLSLTGFSFFLNSLKWTHGLAVASMVLYVLSFAMSLGPICWLMISEIMPIRIRGVGASVATSANWCFNILVAMTFLTLLRKLGPSGTFWIYSAICALAWVFVYFFVPETKGRSLEEIESVLRGQKRPITEQ